MMDIGAPTIGAIGTTLTPEHIRQALDREDRRELAERRQFEQGNPRTLS